MLDLNKVAEKWTRPLRFSNIKLHTALLKLEFRDLSKKVSDVYFIYNYNNLHSDS